MNEYSHAIRYFEENQLTDESYRQLAVSYCESEAFTKAYNDYIQEIRSLNLDTIDIDSHKSMIKDARTSYISAISEYKKKLSGHYSEQIIDNLKKSTLIHEKEERDMADLQ